MQVHQIMTTQIQTVKADTPISEVINILTTHKYSGLPVVDQDNEIIGIISEKDILRHLFPDYDEFMNDMLSAISYEFTEDKKTDLAQLKAEKIMVKNVITISPSTHIMKACAAMVVNKIRRIPVVDEDTDKIVGIVSQGDVFQAILHKSIE